MKSVRLAFLGALLTASALLALTLVPLQAQAPGSLRTPWGEPDFQGIWNLMYDTPVERPEEYAGREFLTDEEVKALDIEKAGDPGRNTRAEPGSDRDVGGAYNAVFNSVLRTGRRTSLIIDPPDGRIPPLTPDAARRQTAPRARGTDGPEDRSAGERCLGATMPDFGGGIFASGTTIRIAQSPRQVAIYYEHNHGGGASRLIPVDGSPHLPPQVRLWLGDSRGRWDGDTLIVDTTNFTDRTPFRGSGANLHMIERYRRVDGTTLHREVTLEDPTVWTRPWTVLIELGKGDDRQNLIFDSACHEGNFGMTGILAGARAEERAAGTRR